MSQHKDPDKSQFDDPVGASRFWEHYGSARPERGPGGPKARPKPNGNGNGRPTGPGPKVNGGDPFATNGPTSAGPNDGPASEAGSGATHDAGAGHTHTEGHECLEWCPFCRGAELLRATVPPEFHDQLAALARDSSALLKALVDSHLASERANAGTAPPREEGPIEDIPID